MTKLKDNELLLLSGNDIPFEQGSLIIHPLRMKEIAFMGELDFHTGNELLRFSKDLLPDEDKKHLSQYSDFQVLMSIMNDKSGSLKHSVSCALTLLELIFPLYDISITPISIEMRLKEDSAVGGAITNDNFNDFKESIKVIFCIDKTQGDPEYNVQDNLAKKIAEKFRNRKKKLAEVKPKSSKISIFSRYISILTVGEQKDMNTFMNYTVYQLFDEFQRFELKENYTQYFSARLAGAKDMETPEPWMKDIHE